MDLAVGITKKKFEFECQTNISKAKSLISNGMFSEATTLLGFYTKDMECYSDVSLLLEEIKIGICSKFIGQARGHWSNRNSKSAAQSLSNINSNSPCYEESLSISKEILGYLDEKEKKEFVSSRNMEQTYCLPQFSSSQMPSKQQKISQTSCNN